MAAVTVSPTLNMRSDALTLEQNPALTTRRRGESLNHILKESVLHPQHPLSLRCNELLRSVTDDATLKVIIIKSKEHNAAAYPGGLIAVTTALAESLEYTEEMQALLKHEANHIENDHAYAFRSTSYGRKTISLVRYHEFESDTAEALDLSARGINPVGALSLHERLLRMENEAPDSLPINEDFVHGDPELRADTIKELFRLKDLPYLKKEQTPEDFKELVSREFTPAPLEEIHSQCMEDFWIAAASSFKVPATRTYVRQIFDDAHRNVPTILIPQNIRDYYDHRIHRQLSLQEIADFLESKDYQEVSINTDKETWVKFITNAINEIDFSTLPEHEYPVAMNNIERIVRGAFGDDLLAIARFSSTLLGQYLKSTNSFEKFTARILSPEPYLALTHIPPQSLFNGMQKKIIDAIRLFGMKTFDVTSLGDICMVESGIQELIELEGESFNRHEEEYKKANQHRIKDPRELRSKASHYISTKDTFLDPKSMHQLEIAVETMGTAIGAAFDTIAKQNSSGDLRALGVLWATTASISTDTNEAERRREHMAQLDRETKARIDALYLEISSATLRTTANIPQLKRIGMEDFFKGLFALATEESKSRPIEDVRADLIILREALRSVHAFASEDFQEKLNEALQGSVYSHENTFLLYLHRLGGIPKILQTYFLTSILGTSSADDIIDILNKTGDHFTKFEIDDNQFPSEQEIQTTAVNRYTFIKSCLDEYENLREFGWPLPRLTQEDLAKVHTVHTGRKIQILTTLADTPQDQIPKIAHEQIAEWPLTWPVISRETHETLWIKISRTMHKWATGKDGTFTQMEYEGLASLLLLSQGSMVAPRATGLLLVRSIELTENFEDAFRVLERFSFLPLNVLKEPIDTVMNLHARKPEDIRKLRDFVFSRLSQTQIGDILIGAHLSYGVSALGLTLEDRLDLVKSLLTTNKSDAHLMELSAVQWWRGGLPPKARDLSLRDVGLYAVLADRRAPPAVPLTHHDVERAIHEARRGPEALGIDSFVPFQDSYRQLFSGGPVFNYILLRQLLIAHSRGFGATERAQMYDHHLTRMNALPTGATFGETSLLDSPEKRLAIFNHLCAHYISGGTETEAALTSPTVRSVIRALAYGPSSRTLFHNVGPLLAALTAQTPESPARIEDIPEGLWSLVLQSLETVYSDLARPFRGQDFRYLKGVTRARVIMMLTGSAPQITLDTENNQILSSPSPERGYVSCEDTIVDNVLRGFPANRQTSIKGSMSVIELATLVAEHNHAIGRRMLQLYALIKGNTLDANDRSVIEESFDRSPGMDVLRAFDVIDGNAKQDPKLAAFIDQIESVEPIEFGGSIFTVPETTLTDGSKYALHVCNTNAAWHCHEVRDFYHEIIANLDPAEISDRDRQLALYLLDMATEWTLDEIEDPNFTENHERFAETINTAQSEQFPFYVPRIIHVDTLAVRPQEWFEGKTLTTLSISKSTDIRAGKISADDAKVVAAHIAQQFAQQLFEHGVDARIHSNIHPGNFSIKPRDSTTSTASNGSLTVGILDTKNMLELSKEERETLVKCAFLFSKGKQDESTNLLFDMILGPSSRDRSSLLHTLQEVVQNMKGQPFESIFSAALGSIVEAGERPSLKWLLLGQNILGCMYILKRFGWEGSLADALFLAEQPDGSWKSDIKNAATLYPNAWGVISANMNIIEKLGFKLGSSF